MMATSKPTFVGSELRNDKLLNQFYEVVKPLNYIHTNQASKQSDQHNNRTRHCKLALFYMLTGKFCIHKVFLLEQQTRLQIK